MEEHRRALVGKGFATGCHSFSVISSVHLQLLTILCNLTFRQITTQIYEFINTLDGNHPVWTVEAPRGNISHLIPYNNGTDIHGYNIYPVSYPPGSSSSASSCLHFTSPTSPICNIRYRHS